MVALQIAANPCCGHIRGRFSMQAASVYRLAWKFVALRLSLPRQSPDLMFAPAAAKPMTLCM
jgi:hypothetical protein